MRYSRVLFLIGLCLTLPAALAGGPASWGHARDTQTEYEPMKVVYDVTTGNAEAFKLVLDRTSYLSKITGSDPLDQSIVLVLHGSAPKFFAIQNYAKYKSLQERAQSLTVGGLIQFKMCKLAAAGQGFKPEDIQGFVEMVPMGDAEIVRLQYMEKHAYMR